MPEAKRLPMNPHHARQARAALASNKRQAVPGDYIRVPKPFADTHVSTRALMGDPEDRAIWEDLSWHAQRGGHVTTRP